MKILITACNGQLGIDLTAYYEKKPGVEVAAYKDVDLDITDEKLIMETVEKEKPDVIINTAAITNVDGCENNIELARKVNAFGAGVMARAAASVDAELVHISTDYVFAGDSPVSYKESDDPNPQSAYGLTKYEGEKEVEKYEKHYILRTAWLYGPHGKNFVKTIMRVGSDKGEVSVVTDQKGNPTSTFELVRIIDAVITKGEYGIYHATCNGFCSWNEFTREIFRVTGLNAKVNDVTSDQYKTASDHKVAKRPDYSNLSKDKLFEVCGYKATDWHDALNEYFEYVKNENK